MKCIKLKNSEIKKVTNEQAEKLVSLGEAEYCSKQEWKKQVRDAKN